MSASPASIHGESNLTSRVARNVAETDMSAVHAAAEVQIEAPITMVWKTLTDFAHWSQWNNAVSRVHVVGPIAPGTVFRWKSGGAPIRSRIAEVCAPYRIAWTGRMLGIRARHAWMLYETAEETRVRTEESFSGFLPRLFPSVAHSILSKALTEG